MKYIFFTSISLILFSCSGCRDDSATNTTAPGFVLVFLEQFSNGIDTNWINVSASLDAITGNSAPSLECDTNASLTWTRLSVSPYSGSTISTHIAVLQSSSGLGRFIVFDTAFNTLALSEIQLSRNGSNLHLNCIIGTSVTNVDVPYDSIFHSYEFKVEPNGTAYWRRNGTTLHSFQNYPLTSRLRMKYITAGYNVRYDNVKVTVP